jgi:hypothetical protein
MFFPFRRLFEIIWRCPSYNCHFIRCNLDDPDAPHVDTTLNDHNLVIYQQTIKEAFHQCFFPQAVSICFIYRVDLRIWEITLIKPLKRWYQPKNLHINVTYGLESFGGVGWQPPVSSAPWHGTYKVMLCAATTNQEPWTGLDWAVHGQEPAYFVVFSGISDGFEDNSCDIIVHPTNTYWPLSQKIKQGLRAVNYFFPGCYNMNMAKPIINTVSFQG